jgi:hypothetical protein|tara:strand:- start:152 stop:469 length:318 start_codon:yes stop_codon:yes gene_type:complete
MTDSDYYENIHIIHHDVDTIIKAWNTGWYHGIVFPFDGIGTGIAKLKTRAPRTHQFLLEEIERLKSLVASTMDKHELMKQVHSEEEEKRWEGSAHNDHLTHPDEL